MTAPFALPTAEVAKSVITDPLAKPKRPHPESLDLVLLSRKFTEAGLDSTPRTGEVDVARAADLCPPEIASTVVAVLGITVAVTERVVTLARALAAIAVDRGKTAEGKAQAAIPMIDQLRVALEKYEPRIADARAELLTLMRPVPPRSGDAASLTRQRWIVDTVLQLGERQRAQLVREVVQRLEDADHPRDRETLTAMYGAPFVVQQQLFGERVHELETTLGRALFPERVSSCDWLQWSIERAEFSLSQTRNWLGIVRAGHGQPVDAAYRR